MLTDAERMARVVDGMSAGNVETERMVVVVGKFLVVSCGVHEKQN
jgi:hypothetical protein